MNTVKIIVKDKNVVRVFDSWPEALESMRWWVVLDHTERIFIDALFGK